MSAGNRKPPARPPLALVPPATDEALIDWLVNDAAAAIAREDAAVERLRRGEPEVDPYADFYAKNAKKRPPPA